MKLAGILRLAFCPKTIPEGLIKNRLEFPPVTCNTNLAGDQYIYISTPSITNVNFKIIENGGNTIAGIVNNTNPYVYAIGAGDNTPLFTPKTSPYRF